jgi:hypothetical protein
MMVVNVKDAEIKSTSRKVRVMGLNSKSAIAAGWLCLSVLRTKEYRRQRAQPKLPYANSGK